MWPYEWGLSFACDTCIPRNAATIFLPEYTRSISFPEQLVRPHLTYVVPAYPFVNPLIKMSNFLVE